MEGEDRDREARIARRRARIEAIKKKKHAKAKGQGESSASNDINELRSSKQQIKISRNVVDQAFDQAVDAVINIKTDAEYTEMKRRRAEIGAITATREKIDEALNQSDIKNANLEEGWAVLSNIKTPMELEEALKEKEKECSVLDQAKIALIRELENMLVKRDEEYTKRLQSNVEDVGATLTSMKSEFRGLYLEYEKELKKIEESFSEERTKLLKDNQAELNELFDLRMKRENAVLKDAEGKEDQYYDEIRTLRLKSKEEYNNLKVTLEANIQMLQQQLEEMRATYQLNIQKLEYNLHILKERDAENRQTVDQFRKKIHKLQDQLSKYTAKYREEDEKFKGENAKLTADYRRITEKFKDLQKKYRHFEYLDEKRYQDVFEMNKKSVLKLADKVMTADRIIHDQILGKPWKLPETYEKVKKHSEISEKNTKQKADEKKTVGAKPVYKYTNEHIRIVMTLLAKECQFLIDSNTLEACKTASLAETQLLKANAILSSIGLRDRGDLERLCSLFFESHKETAVKVDSGEVVSLVRSFIFDNSKIGVGRERTLKTIRDKKDLQFWDNLKNCLPQRSERTWAALEKGLFRYNKLLKNRQDDINETNELLKTNGELKMLLQQYLESKNNDDFQLPPTHFITGMQN